MYCLHESTRIQQPSTKSDYYEYSVVIRGSFQFNQVRHLSFPKLQLSSRILANVPNISINHSQIVKRQNVWILNHTCILQMLVTTRMGKQLEGSMHFVFFQLSSVQLSILCYQNTPTTINNKPKKYLN